MCAITGVLSLTGVSKYGQVLQAANQAAAHRGPDGQGVAFLNVQAPEQRLVAFNADLAPEPGSLQRMTLGLGHRRLAILDLSSAGLQPMPNQDATLWIVFNGEIYNFLELRHELARAGHVFRSQSDTEVILHAYETWGEHCVQHFVGMWAFALADLRQQRLFCSRDRFGIKPFHYYHDAQHFVFASEIKQLLHFPCVPRRVHEKAVYEYLMYEGIDWGEETFFRDIYKLLPGHNLLLNLNDGTYEKRQYYPPQFTIDRRITFPEAAGEFRRLLTESVDLHLRSDVKVGSCLSGGLDSSAIVCLMQGLLKGAEQTDLQYTFSSHFDAEEANEMVYTQAVIDATGVQAHFICPTPEDFLRDVAQLVWYQEEPFNSTSIFAQWSVFKLIRQHDIKVVLDGQGADEQLAGYVSLAPYYFLELAAKQRYGRLLAETWRHARLQGRSWLALLPGQGGVLARKLPWYTPPGVAAPALDWLHPEMVQRCEPGPGYMANLNVRPFALSEYLNNVLYQFTFLNNLPQLLKYEDRNSMAFSIESRVPFLDHRLVDFVFSLPSHFKIRQGYTKSVMRTAMRGIIPEQIRQRARKMGFATPERRWQQTILRPLIRQALSDERLHAFLVPEKAAAYLTYLDTHQLLNFSPWRWVNLHLWLDAYALG